jgi:hypothetical protein
MAIAYFDKMETNEVDIKCLMEGWREYDRNCRPGQDIEFEGWFLWWSETNPETKVIGMRTLSSVEDEWRQSGTDMPFDYWFRREWEVKNPSIVLLFL